MVKKGFKTRAQVSKWSHHNHHETTLEHANGVCLFPCPTQLPSMAEPCASKTCVCHIGLQPWESPSKNRSGAWIQHDSDKVSVSRCGSRWCASSWASAGGLPVIEAQETCRPKEFGKIFRTKTHRSRSRNAKIQLIALSSLTVARDRKNSVFTLPI